MKKKYTTLVFLLAVCFTTFSQLKKESREKIKALKVAYLTEELNLSSKEAQKFWPVYNEHREKVDFLRNKARTEIKKKLKEIGSVDNLSEDEAKYFVNAKLDSDKQIAKENENFNKKISKFLSYKKIIKLHLSEREFAKKLMRKYKTKRQRSPR